MAVTYLRLLRSIRLMYTFDWARRSSSREAAAEALAAFFWESFSARFWASTERVAVAALRASVVGVRLGASWVSEVID